MGLKTIGSIPKRAGVDVSINDDLTIDIIQTPEPNEDDVMIVTVHPEDVDQLIELLQRGRDEVRRIKEIGEAASADMDNDGNPVLRSVD